MDVKKTWNPGSYVDAEQYLGEGAKKIVKRVRTTIFCLQVLRVRHPLRSDFGLYQSIIANWMQCHIQHNYGSKILFLT